MSNDAYISNVTVVTAKNSSTVGSTYTGHIPGYGPTPAVINGPITGNGYYTIGTTQPTYQPNIHISGSNPSLSTDKDKIDLNELAELMKIMRERLLILVPNFEKHEKYEALKKAYDQYKLIEAMIAGKEDGK